MCSSIRRASSTICGTECLKSEESGKSMTSNMCMSGDFVMTNTRISKVPKSIGKSSTRTDTASGQLIRHRTVSRHSSNFGSSKENAVSPCVLRPVEKDSSGDILHELSIDTLKISLIHCFHLLQKLCAVDTILL